MFSSRHRQSSHSKDAAAPVAARFALVPPRFQSFPVRVLGLGLAGVLAIAGLSGCDQKPKTAGKPAAEKKKAGPSVDQQFDAARVLLMEGKFADAAAGFHQAGEDASKEKKIRQPKYNWITTMEGMALLLDGREKEARAVYAELAKRGPFSEKEQDAVMAKFFVDIGQALAGETAIPATVAKDYDKWTFEGIVFLLFALKDWNMEKTDEAIPLFRQFANVQPDKMVEWADGPADLKKLQEISDSCVDDYLEGRPALQALEAAASASIDDQAAALEKAKASRKKMKLVTKVAKDIDAKIAELTPKVNEAMASRSKMAAEDAEYDAKELPAAKKKRADLQAKFMFTEAKTAMLEPNLKTEKAKDEQQLLAKKSSWLANYKDQLIEDLNAKGYAAPLTPKKGGAPITGGVAKADQQSLMINSPQGPKPVAWADVSLDSLFTMGQSFVSPDLPPAILAFRKWHLGVFGSYAGKPESMAMLKEAAELRSLFAEELPVFEKPSDPW